MTIDLVMAMGWLWLTFVGVGSWKTMTVLSTK
jgi:hypothetical protein